MGTGGASSYSYKKRHGKLTALDFNEKKYSSVKQYHEDIIAKLRSDDYSDGTYNIETLNTVDYHSGYQVTFCQIGDDYTDQEYQSKVDEFLAVSDGIVYAGKFESEPEISFYVKNKRTAIRLAKKYNQISVWDWKAIDEIETGGTGRRNND